jgi:glycosyltransferase involved in cell wall biosynthesis
MPGPIVSVIIPAYNAERYLDQALDSVLAQTFGDFECIVVDDGSTDATPRIAGEREGVIALRQENRGAAAARNAGIRAARGTYLTFLDADNLWYPQRLEIQVDFHRRHPEIDYSHVDLEERIEDGFEAPSWALARQKDAGLTYALRPCGLMIDRAAMLRLGGFNARFQAGQAAEWLSRARDAGLKGERLAQTLGMVRIHGENMSHNQDNTRRFVLQALHESIRRKRNGQAANDTGSGHE